LLNEKHQDEDEPGDQQNVDGAAERGEEFARQQMAWRAEQIGAAALAAGSWLNTHRPRSSRRTTTARRCHPHADCDGPA